jgi:hypothetical protein
VALDSANSCDAPAATPMLSSASDCILFNAISTPISGAASRVEFPPIPDVSDHATLPDVEILAPEVGSPLHFAARARRRNYDHNRHFQDR